MATLTVKCNDQVEVVCSLHTNRVENFISRKLSNQLKLEKTPQRNFIFDEFHRDLSCFTSRVHLLISVGQRKISCAASVIDMPCELIIGTDTMARLGLKLTIGQCPISLPRESPLSHDWLIGVLSEIEKRLQGPQKATPTCRLCKQPGHVMSKCPMPKEASPSESEISEDSRGEEEDEADERKEEDEANEREEVDETEKNEEAEEAISSDSSDETEPLNDPEGEYSAEEYSPENSSDEEEEWMEDFATHGG